MPECGTVFISVNDYDKPVVAKIARDLHRLGFELIATDGTSSWLNRMDIDACRINKLSEGRPHIIDAMQERRIKPDNQHAAR